MKYRLASRSDHIGLMMLDRLCFEQPMSGMDWYDWMNAMPIHVFSVESQVVGYIASFNEYKKGVQIARFAVHPQHRRSGIGSRLIDLVVKSAATSTIYTYVEEDYVFDGVGKFLNANNFEAKRYVGRKKRNRIKFAHTGCDPEPTPVPQRRPNATAVG